MKTVSLFSGIGGLDLGLEDAGHEIIMQVESDPHCVQARALPPLPAPLSVFRRCYPVPRTPRPSFPAPAPIPLPRPRRSSSTTSPGASFTETSRTSPTSPSRRNSSPRVSRARCAPPLLPNQDGPSDVLGDGGLSLTRAARADPPPASPDPPTLRT